MSPQRKKPEHVRYADLDEFNRERAKEVAGAFLEARRELDMRIYLDLWTGMMCSRFDDHDLMLLEAVGLFSPLDRQLLCGAGRHWKTYPAAEPFVESFYGAACGGEAE